LEEQKKSKKILIEKKNQNKSEKKIEQKKKRKKGEQKKSSLKKSEKSCEFLFSSLIYSDHQVSLPTIIYPSQHHT